MKHHTKDKGDIGVLKAQADLALKGYVVLHPLTERASFDLVVYKDQAFMRAHRYVSLRVNIPKNGQRLGINLASDFLEAP